MRDAELTFREVELEPPASGDLEQSLYYLHFGSKSGPQSEISKNGLTMRIAERPVAKNLRRLYELGHVSLPTGLNIYDAYDIWIIAHAVGVIRTDGSGLIESVGYEADFGDDEEVLTIDLLPQTRFQTALETTLEVQADVGAEGHVDVPEPAREMLDQAYPIGGDAHIRLSTAAGTVGRVTLPVMTPRVQAIGKMGSRCQWQFETGSEPVLGDQVMLQTMLVPIGTRSISYRVRGRVLLRADWVSFAVPRRTKWIDVTCQLT